MDAKKNSRETVSKFTMSKCPVCGQELAQHSILIHLARYHDYNHTYFCKLCGKRFKRTIKLYKHYKYDHYLSEKDITHFISSTLQQKQFAR
jgi:uncharacterized Zn finger protein